MNQDSIFEKYNFEYLEDEGVYIKNIYNTYSKDDEGMSHAIGIYCNSPKSYSRFHRLSSDELWHYYGGEPFVLHLIYPDGKYKMIKMGANYKEGETLTFLVPKGVWQAGETMGNTYSLFACTVVPSFYATKFELRNLAHMIKDYPHLKDIINKF